MMDFDLQDAHVYGGLLICAVGVAFIYPPAGLVALGLGLVYIGLRF